MYEEGRPLFGVGGEQRFTSTGSIWIHRTIEKSLERKYICPNLLDSFVKDGWIQGKGPQSGKTKCGGKVWVYHPETKDTIPILPHELIEYSNKGYVKGCFFTRKEAKLC
jgi:hypothetical protein